MSGSIDRTGAKCVNGRTRVYESLNPGAVLTDIYTVPSGKRARVMLIMCNRANSNKQFRIAISPLGVAIDPSHYTHYDQTIVGNFTHEDGIFYELIATDIIRVYGSDDNVSFTVNGIEENE